MTAAKAPERVVNAGIGADAVLPATVTDRSAQTVTDLPLLPGYEMPEGEK